MFVRRDWKFVYLGSMFTSDRKCDKDIEREIECKRMKCQDLSTGGWLKVPVM